MCQPTDGGTAVVVRELVRAGVAAGDKVTVASPAGGYLSRWVQAAGATWIELPMSRAPSPRDLRVVPTVRRLLASADVVHLHSSKAGAVGRLAARSMGARRPRVVFTPHGWSWYVSERLARAFVAFERWAARCTDVIVAVSADEQRDGHRMLGDAAPIVLIENGVDTTAFTPDGARADRGAATLVVQVGRLSRQKGQDRSIRALARCHDPELRLRLVGDGPDLAALRDLAQELEVGHRVEFAGSVDPRPHLRAADVVVLPSRWEGMSLVLLEAMAVGAAIVASDCGGSDALAGVGELIEHEDDDAAVAQLGSAVSALNAEPERRSALGRAARERAEQRFGLAATVSRYEAIWRDR